MEDRKTILIEMQLNNKEEAQMIYYLVKNKIKHNIYSFEIGHIHKKIGGIKK